jgi:uridylate kinase
MRLAIKIGGSISIGEKGPDPEFAAAFRNAVADLGELQRLAVGIGGGKLARGYLHSIRSIMGPDEAESVVVELLRANTKFMALLLGGRAIMDEPSIAKALKFPEEILVIGGIKPGRSTDANTALLAKSIHADLFVKMTDVDGVYSADPDADRSAELLDRITYDQLYELSIDGTPGSYGVLDRTAIRVLQEARIPSRVIDGRDPRILLRLQSGSDTGTLISDQQ